VNDISGLTADPKMLEIIKKYQCRVVVMHRQGDSRIMQKNPRYQNCTQEVNLFFKQQIKKCLKIGIRKQNIILDPGIGFGKTPECNRSLLKFSEMTNFPVMIGYSRKRFLGQNRMGIEPNLEAGRVAIESGAAYLRVHDVAAHRKMLQNLKNQ
jgi:dihydropteroate synthase